jgi:hypothetical protein
VPAQLSQVGTDHQVLETKVMAPVAWLVLHNIPVPTVLPVLRSRKILYSYSDSDSFSNSDTDPEITWVPVNF